MSGNELRARQAFTAAQAGVDHALDYLIGDPLGIDRDQNGLADVVVARDNVLPATYRFVYCNDAEEPVCPDAPGYPSCALDTDNFKSPLIVSCGWSDDETGRKLIRLQATNIPGLGGTPNAPAIVKSWVNVQGSATIWNFYTNLTVWTGGDLESIGNSGKTYVRNPDVLAPDHSVAPPNPSKTETASGSNLCGTDSQRCWLESTDSNTTGPDVIPNDPVLAGLDDALFFQNYLGASDLDSYREHVAEREIAAAQSSILDDGDALGQAIVINGNTTLPNGIIGSRDRPVILVINGDWEGGNATVWGVVYVMGNVDIAGNPMIYGAMIAEGTMSGTGSIDIVYDPYAILNARDRTGRPSWAAGTWRDW